MGSNFMVKGKKIEWLAKRGWKTVAEIGAHSKLFSVYEKIRTDFRGIG